MKKNNPNMRFLIVGPELEEGGADQYMFNQACLLLKHGYQVSCIAFSGGSLENAYKQQIIPFSVCPVSHMNNHKIHTLIADYDFVIANTMYTIFFAHEAQKYKPTMLILHEPPAYMEYIFSRTSLSRKEIREIRHLFGVSQRHIDSLKEIGLDTIKVLNNFVSDIYHTIPSDRSKSLKTRYLTVANWHQVKGYDLALKAFQNLTDTEKGQLEWHIVGKMITEPECKDFQQDIETEPWIYFHGYITDKKELYELYKNSDIYIHVSREETCSLTVMDAAMMKKPLIVSKDVGANYLADNGAGWIVDEHDHRNITEAIRESLNQNESLESMGDIARKNYLANATPDIYFQSFIKNCKAIIATDKMILKDSQKKHSDFYKNESSKILKIALYGYNLFTQIEYFYYLENHPYKLDGIYDQAYEHYRARGLDIKNPMELNPDNFDFLCICCMFESTIQAIKIFLKGIGVPSTKICVGLRPAFESMKAE